MPIATTFKLPDSPALLELPEDPKSVFFLCFVSSDDPVSKQPWCPDVRAALPHIRDAFSGEGPEVALVEVGQRPEYVSFHSILETFCNTCVSGDYENPNADI